MFLDRKNKVYNTDSKPKDKTTKQAEELNSVLEGFELFTKTNPVPDIDVNEAIKNLEQDRLNRIHKYTDPINEAARIVEIASSIYSLGAGASTLSLFNKMPKINAFFSNPLGLDIAKYSGLVADLGQTGTGIAEKNVGSIVENSTETLLNTAGLVGHSDVLRHLPGRLSRTGVILDNIFDNLPYIQSTYDLSKDTIYPSIETLINANNQ